MENTVFIAGKALEIYEKAIRAKLSQTKEIKVKTRGNYILNAIKLVTCLEQENFIIIKNTKIFRSNFKVNEINRFVSEIEITLIKK